MPEAAIRATDAGLVPAGEGWFVLNLLAAAWERKGEFGVRCRVEAPDARFPRFGIAIHVLEPGQPNALYHAEETQEGFLVLAGECRAIVAVWSGNCAGGTISIARPTRHTSSSEQVRNRASSS